MTIYCCGSNRLNQLLSENEDPEMSENNFPIVYPPEKKNLSNILSFSTYRLHSLFVDKFGQAYQWGSTKPSDYFANTTEKNKINQQEIIIKDHDKPCRILSAVCGYCYSLFLVQGQEESEDSNKSKNRLAYYYKTQSLIPPIDKGSNENEEENDDDFQPSDNNEEDEVEDDEDANCLPQFYDTEGVNPISIYGGWKISAAIEKKDQLIIFNPSQYPPNKKISFPTEFLAGAIPISVACLEDSIIILFINKNKKKNNPDTQKRVIEYKLSQNEDEDNFNEINIKNVKQISGTYKHCFLVTEDNHVYGRGNNKYGQLGLGEITNENKKVDEFIPIVVKEGEEEKEIISAFAGFNHSLFITKENEVYACGSNSHGQLFFDPKKTKSSNVPIKIDIQKRVSFCIAGDCSSVLLVDDSPLNWPNKVYKNTLKAPDTKPKT